MIVGTWNIERAAGIESRDLGARARAQQAATMMVNWILECARREEPVGLLFLTEVSQGGGEMAAYLMGQLPDYNARYVPAPDRNYNPSPCSFMVLWHRELENSFGGIDIEPTGATTRRPMVKVRLSFGMFAGVHIIANEEEAPHEIAVALTEIAWERPALMIGDMNYPYDKLNEGTIYNPSLADTIYQQLGFTPYSPDLRATWGRHNHTTGILRTKVFDYVWAKGVGDLQARPPINNYQQWTFIDHAPIAYSMNLP